MRRREVLAGVGGAIVLAARPARSQQRRSARIGWLSGGPAGRPGSPLSILKNSLHDLGWRIDETLEIDERHAAGDTASLPRLAAELVAKRPAVIGATGGTEAKALQDATRDIPVVFMQMAWDPVAAGLVQSIARPGGNLTGFLQSPELLWGKRLDFLKELLGGPPRRLAFIGNPGNTSFRVQWENAGAEAARIGADIRRADIGSSTDLENAFAKVGDRDALLVQWDFLLVGLSERIADVAVRLRLPAIYEQRAPVIAGGLMSYGADLTENYRQGAAYIDRILKGALAADLPVVQGNRLELVLNKAAAAAIGLGFSPSLLARADEVIE
jgi:putative tryptophan/tyrosine transport system substrate-binding protein